MSEPSRSLEAVRGFLALGMIADAWLELDTLPPALRSTEEVVRTRIKLHHLLKQWQRAAKLAESMARRAPENPDWWIEWAYSLRKGEQAVEARGVLWEAVQIHPGVAVIHYHLACNACALGDHAEARAVLARAIRLDANLEAAAIKEPELRALF